MMRTSVFVRLPLAHLFPVVSLPCFPSVFSLFSYFPLNKVPTTTTRPPSTSAPSLRTWTRRRKPRRSTLTSPVPPTPRTCSSFSTPSLTSSSRTTWRTAGSSRRQKQEDESRCGKIRKTFQLNTFSVVIQVSFMFSFLFPPQITWTVLMSRGSRSGRRLEHLHWPITTTLSTWRPIAQRSPTQFQLLPTTLAPLTPTLSQHSLAFNICIINSLGCDHKSTVVFPLSIFVVYFLSFVGFVLNNRQCFYILSFYSRESDVQILLNF